MGSITEPELISAIESLKRVRVSLRKVLYVEKGDRHTSYLEFLRRFGASVTVTPKRILDIKSLGVVGDRLLEVLDKQTKGSGVKNCYDLVDIHTKGRFVLVASQVQTEVLCLKVEGQPDRGLDYLQDLRAKLMMTEISAELDNETAQEPGAKAGVKTLLEAFAQQVEVLERIRDQIHALCCAGHYGFQKGHEISFGFDDVTSAALDRLNETHAKNHAELRRWTAVVEKAREQCFFLNFFTMQEIWGFRDCTTHVLKATKEAVEMKKKAETDPKLKGKAARRAATAAKAAAAFETMLHLVTSSTSVVSKALSSLLINAGTQNVGEVCLRCCHVSVVLQSALLSTCFRCLGGNICGLSNITN